MIPSRLEDLRRKKQLSQESLAKLTGINLSYVSAIEHGQMLVPINKLEKVYEVLDTDLRGLYPDEKAREILFYKTN